VTRGRADSGSRTSSSRCSGAKLVGEGQRLVEVARDDRRASCRQRLRRDAIGVRGELALYRLDGAPCQRGIGGDQHGQGERVVLSLRHQVGRDLPRSALESATIATSLGPASASMRTSPTSCLFASVT